MPRLKSISRQYPISEMISSWAGAFGQTQFTPTTFLKFASDGDGDGQINLWAQRAGRAGLGGNLAGAAGLEERPALGL